MYAIWVFLRNTLLANYTLFVLCCEFVLVHVYVRFDLSFNAYTPPWHIQCVYGQMKGILSVTAFYLFIYPCHLYTYNVFLVFLFLHCCTCRRNRRRIGFICVKPLVAFNLTELKYLTGNITSKWIWIILNPDHSTVFGKIRDFIALIFVLQNKDILDSLSLVKYGFKQDGDECTEI